MIDTIVLNLFWGLFSFVISFYKEYLELSAGPVACAHIFNFWFLLLTFSSRLFKLTAAAPAAVFCGFSILLNIQNF